MKLSRFNEISYAHFITSRTFASRPIFRNGQCCRILLNDLDFYRQKLGFKLLGYVIMPDHWHCIIWWDAEGYLSLTISIIMHRIKGRSAKRISDYILSGGHLMGRQGFYALPGDRRGIKAPATRVSGVLTHNVNRVHEVSTRDAIKIWQPSFYDFNIYSERKLREKLNYVHYNPVRAGLCKNAEDWKWSSYRDYEFGENRF